jgi:hypothetical protein
MRKVLIERMPDSENADVSFERDRGLARGKVNNGRSLKCGERTTAALAAGVSTIAIRKAW